MIGPGESTLQLSHRVAVAPRRTQPSRYGAAGVHHTVRAAYTRLFMLVILVLMQFGSIPPAGCTSKGLWQHPKGDSGTLTGVQPLVQCANLSCLLNIYLVLNGKFPGHRFVIDFTCQNLMDLSFCRLQAYCIWTGAQHTVYTARALVSKHVVHAKGVEYMENMCQAAWRQIDASPVMDEVYANVLIVKGREEGE